MLREMTPLSSIEYFEYTTPALPGSEALRSAPFPIDFIPLDIDNFAFALTAEAREELGAVSKNLASRVASYSDLEVAQQVAEIPTKTHTKIDRGAGELRSAVTVTGHDKAKNHRLTVAGDTAFLEGMADVQIKCAVKLYAIMLGCEEGYDLPDNIVEDLHRSYTRVQIHRAHIYAARIQPVITSYVESIEHDTTISEAERKNRLAHVNTLRFNILDPIEFFYSNQAELVELLHPKRRHVDTRYLDPVKKSNRNVSATYNPTTHSCQFPLPKDLEDDDLHLKKIFHEIAHGESPHVSLKTPEGGLRVKRLGFSTNARNRSDTVSVTMHHDLNEGVNDYFARQRLGEDPLAHEEFYPGKRLVVDALMDLTGVELWKAFYNASCTDDKERRQQTYKNLSRSLDLVGGRGFLNRLATTWALYGDDYTLDLIDKRRFGEFRFVKPLDLPAAYQALEDEAIVIDDLPEIETVSARKQVQ